MELLIGLGVGVVVGSAVYLMLQREILRVIMGSLLIGYGVNLVLFMSGGIKKGGPPVLREDGMIVPVTDPVPQALILTAIVIGLGVFALLLALGYRTFQEHATSDLEDLAGVEHE